MLFNYDGKEEALEKVILSADIVAQIVMCFIDKGKELTHAALAVGGAAELVFNTCEEEYVSVRIVAAVIAVAAPLSIVLMEKTEEYQPETLLVPA
jgi:hypothetical protein